MIQHKIHLPLALVAAALVLVGAAGCDSGDIYPERPAAGESAGGSDASFSRVQSEVFTAQCIMCHGGSAGAPAGNLRLTAGDSYGDLVGVSAANPSAGKKRVAPGDISQSFLVDVLENWTPPGFQTDHSKLSTLKDSDVLLIKRWILDGAENDKK
ncbi:MAG: hypothetical protein LBK22_08355 [Tannerella sp.]|jgi:hypothetical protein|nr:hypothetical protein [Tannerella sp.]